MTVGEIKGAGEETEVNIPEGLIRPGPELIPPPGRVADGLTEMEGDGFPETVEEGLIAKLEETRLEEAGDWVGRLAAGSVGSTKMVVVMVTMTGSPAAGSVVSGFPSEVGEGGLLSSPP